MPSRSTIAAAVCLAVLAASTVWWTQRPATAPAEPTPAPPSVRTASVPAPASRPVFAPVDTPHPAPAAAKPAPRWRELREQFIHASSMRAFFYDALKRPQDGGYLLATEALYGCARDIPAPTSERQREAIQAWRIRCDFTEQDQEDAQRQFAAIRKLNLNEDPLLAKFFGLTSAKSTDEKAAIVAASIAEGNPVVIASVVYPALEALALQPLPGAKATRPDWLDEGHTLLACRLGMECGPNAPATLSLCALHGWCADNVNDALRAGFGKDYARMDQLTTQVVDAVRRRDLARLVRPR